MINSRLNDKMNVRFAIILKDVAGNRPIKNSNNNFID